MLEGVVIVMAFGWLFFGRLWVGVILSPGIFLYYRKRMLALERSEKDAIRDSYRESLILFKAALFAGLSAENAWRNAASELSALYGDNERTVVCMKNACARLSVNESMEDVICEFAREMDIEEAADFAEVFSCAKKSGGNLSKILAQAADRLTLKAETNRQIRTVMAGKRLEQMILVIIPPAICAFLKLTSPGYMDPLYEGAAGAVIMGLCLAVYLGACALAGKIADIEV